MADITERGFQGFLRKLKDMGAYFAEVVVDGGGQAGCHTETGTSAVTGSFTSITILSDAIFTTFTDAGEVGDGLVGATIPAGITLFGQISAFQLSQGKVRAYK